MKQTKTKKNKIEAYCLKGGLKKQLFAFSEKFGEIICYDGASSGEYSFQLKQRIVMVKSKGSNLIFGLLNSG